jgi:hypothetical protein
LRRAAEIDLGDWFLFTVGAAAPIGNNSLRFPVVAIIGTTTWVEFHLDLSGTDLRLTGHLEDVPPIARGLIPSVEQRGYRVYPLVDHVADKVAATYERHGASENPSTRYRDLVDLVAIATGASIDAQSQSNALRSEFERRNLVPPKTFDVPDRGLWERGYAAEVSKSMLNTASSLEDALVIVKAFLDPLLNGVAAGTWNPDKQEWSDDARGDA